MKKLVITSLTLFSILVSGIAQETVSVSKSPLKREIREDMLLLNFNWVSLLNTNDSTTVSPSSWGFDLKLMYDVPIQNSNFSFALGGGLGIGNYYTNAEIYTGLIGADTVQTQSFFVPVSSTRNIKRNKLTITYADIPFELRYRSSPDKHGYSWKIAVGAKVGYHLQTHAKIIENARKTKSYYFPNAQKWRYGLNVRAAYGRIGINAFYSIASVFENGQGEVVNPFSIGLTLMPF